MIDMQKEWLGFNEGIWTNSINVSDFIKRNYTKYDGTSSNESFLVPKTKKTASVLKECTKLLK